MYVCMCVSVLGVLRPFNSPSKSAFTLSEILFFMYKSDLTSVCGTNVFFFFGVRGFQNVYFFS